jgi:hypothetical protein
MSEYQYYEFRAVDLSEIRNHCDQRLTFAPIMFAVIALTG